MKRLIWAWIVYSIMVESSKFQKNPNFWNSNLKSLQYADNVSEISSLNGQLPYDELKVY